MCYERIERSPRTTLRATPAAIDRRHFLRLNAAGLLGVAQLGSVGVDTVFAQGEPPPGSPLVAKFGEPAEESAVSR
jgi:hypothetical protein